MPRKAAESAESSTYKTCRPRSWGGGGANARFATQWGLGREPREPLSGYSSSGQNAALERAGRVSTRSSHHKVFIIDDDRSLLSLLKLIFEDARFTVHTYLEAQRALADVADLKPDVVILDLEMPVMNGRAFYRALRAKGHQMPVLILSAYGAQAARSELGADEAVDKPFEPEYLVDRVTSLIDRN